MTKANVAELKNRLSAYLREVRNGGEVVVLDRTQPIAKIVPFPSRKSDDFVVIPPSKSWSDVLKLKPIKTKKKIDWQKILNETGEDRNLF